jgi:hypothetical protein
MQFKIYVNDRKFTHTGDVQSAVEFVSSKVFNSWPEHTVECLEATGMAMGFRFNNHWRIERVS